LAACGAHNASLHRRIGPLCVKWIRKISRTGRIVQGSWPRGPDAAFAS
jgi:hypothetical protein